MNIKGSEVRPGMVGIWWDGSTMLVIGVKSIEQPTPSHSTLYFSFLRRYPNGKVVIDYLPGGDDHVVFKDHSVIYDTRS